MAASGSSTGPAEGPQKEQAGSASKFDLVLHRLDPVWRLFPDAAFAPIIAGLFLLGAVLIILYEISTAGPHLLYISVGLITACSAFLIGVLTGLVLAIPRVVSSGTYGQQSSATGEHGEDHGSAPTVLPSTNLAEISDWPTGGIAESAVVMAGAILITYVILGFLGGYLVTAFFYGRVLQRK